MTSHPGHLILSVVEDLRSIEADEWDALASSDGISPFLEYGFLTSLEAAGCCGPDTGWHPRHFVLKSEGSLVAAAPAYIRTHSMGDFIFDQGLAQAAMEMGHDYYPKLVATLPFTPSPGYRFLVHPDLDETAITRLLVSGMDSFAMKAGLHSVSILFADPEWQVIKRVLHPGIRQTGDEIPASDIWLEWIHQYFQWKNTGYRDFDGFLAGFRKKTRRSILRERQSISSNGIRVNLISGEGADESLTDRMFDFYRSTNEHFGPWAAFFLNRSWFHEVILRWGKRVLFFAAYRFDDEQPVAMSMLIRKDKSLIGRYWGTSVFIPNLHFELCYYAPLEYAIEEGLESFDPGMGSPHKARRGFGSYEFSTWHRFTETEVTELFSSVLPEANRSERIMICDLNDAIPLRKES